MELKTVYAVKHKDEEIRVASRSGGVFTAISDVILENGGVVYGCALNENFLAEHRRATTKEERNAFRGSKYIQSEIKNCYSLCADDLKNGIPVLFSGTPCQIEALYNFFSIKDISTEKLITLDILCHGVPSPMVWKDYLKEKFGNQEIESVDFRDKKNFGWRDHVETITVGGREFSSKEFTSLFYSHLILRPNCFSCNYKSRSRISDITIGDYWRIELNDKEYDDDKGVSLVKINTNKGKNIFDNSRINLIVKEYPIATSIQAALDFNYDIPKYRTQFWNDYEKLSFSELLEKYIQ
ncbi:MAG: Coenzyme F420 hydrogenase/dehydrogenase, beta subunit C-terminal domain [Candidatus Gastranaerophilaceae bacterium]